MITLFSLIIITVILVLGMKVATSKGMIFEWVGEWAKKKVEQGHRIYEPLFLCPFCAPSLWSVPAYIFAFGIGIIPFEFNWVYVFYYPLVVCGASFASGSVWSMLENMNAETEKFEAERDYLKMQMQTDNNEEVE